MEDRKTRADGSDESSTPEQPTTAAEFARSARPQRKKAADEATQPAKKGKPTKKRKSARVKEEDKPATPAQFTRESIAELKKVVWPSSSVVRQYFAAVLVFVLFIIAYVTLIDLGLGALLLRALG